MTTRITVRAGTHAVRVQDTKAERKEAAVIVAPGETQDFYIHEWRELLFSEEKKP